MGNLFRRNILGEPEAKWYIHMHHAHTHTYKQIMNMFYYIKSAMVTSWIPHLTKGPWNIT